MISINKKKALSYLEIFVLMVLTVGAYRNAITIVIYLVLFFINYKYIDAFLFPKPIYILFILAVVLPMVLDARNISSNNEYSLVGFAHLMPILLSILLIKKYDKSEFVRKFEKIAFVISVVSIIGFALVMFLPAIIKMFPIITMSDGRKMHSIIIYNSMYGTGSTSLLPRNCGIGFEPGSFQLIPNIGLAFFITYESKSCKLVKLLIHESVYVLAIITTKSTTGLLILCILIIFALKNKKKLLIILPVVLMLFIGSNSLLGNQIEKFQSGNMTDRMANSFYVVKNYFHYLLGVGSTAYNKLLTTDPQIKSWDLYSNMFVRYGYPFLICLIYGMIRIFKWNIPIFICIFLTFFSESLFGPVTVMFLLYSTTRITSEEYGLIGLSERKVV